MAATKRGNGEIRGLKKLELPPRNTQWGNAPDPSACPCSLQHQVVLSSALCGNSWGSADAKHFETLSPRHWFHSWESGVMATPSQSAKMCFRGKHDPTSTVSTRQAMRESGFPRHLPYRLNWHQLMQTQRALGSEAFPWTACVRGWNSSSLVHAR